VTLVDVEPIYKHWQRWPPLHWMVALYLGYGKKRQRAQLLRGKAAEEKNREGAEAFMRFMDSVQSGGIRIGGPPGS
jgi:hypothetical protein